MKKVILLILGSFSIIYGIFIHLVGSGTWFWIVWEAIGALFFLWSFLIHKRVFITHKRMQNLLHVFIAIASAVLMLFCSMIVGDFRSQGEPMLDYIIVLGAQVKEDGPSIVLQYRLDKAISYLSDNPTTRCIVSGGQGDNEPFSEAEGMYNYLVANGVDSERIILEDQSTSTVENIRNSKALLNDLYNSVGIVTNDFHVFRAVQIAKVQGLKNISGIAAESNAFYLPNNVLRECCGILNDWLFGNIELTK